VQDVLVQAKRSSHHNGIEKGLLESKRNPHHNGLLESKLTTTFAKNRCIGEKAPMLIWEWDLSSLYGLVPNKSCRKLMLGASSPTRKGTPETSKTGTPITALISYGSI
jgi:hypothetical protein